MDPVSKLTYILVASLVASVAICIMTYRSNFTTDRKIAVYILAVLAPLIGLFTYILFRRYHLKESKGY